MAAVAAARTAKGEVMRQRLLDAAATELLHNDGELELSAVARRAGVSIGLPHRYFGSKSGLLQAVVERFFDEFDAAVFSLELRQAGDWHRRERLRVERFVAFFFRHRLAPVVPALLSGDSGVMMAQQARIGRQIEAAARNIERGQGEGALPADIDPRLYASLVMGGLMQGLLNSLARRTRPKPADVTVALQKFVATVLPGGMR